MKILYSWLKDYIDINLPAEELAKKLTSLGMEVESFEKTGADFEGVYAAKILALETHPNADKLALVDLETAWGKQRVVCGAKNIAAGQTVPLAKVGARLGANVLKPAEIRGVISEGMLCSADELGLAAERQSGIMILEDSVAVGTDIKTLYGKADVIFDVTITPNRADLLSHLGIARELSALLDLPLKNRATKPFNADGEEIVSINLAAGENGCPRYNGRIIKNVKNTQSPAWLKERLSAMGVNPKNAIVDITNFVLFDIGHPMHAFDLNHIEGRQINVRWANEGESFTALNDTVYTLNTQNLVIADANKSLALAGVIGGKGDSISDDTKDIFLEAAYFYPPAVNKTAKKLGISTESSQRFERGTDIDACEAAMNLATSLIAEICGGQCHKNNDAYPAKYIPQTIVFTPSDINKILGVEVPLERTAQILARIGKLDNSKDVWTFVPPSYRRDLTHKWDLAEEVARFAGYELLDSHDSSFSTASLYFGDNPKSVDVGEKLQNALVGIGFFECKNFDFTSSKDLKNFGYDAKNIIELENPLAEGMEFLRPNILPSLLKNISYNQSFNNNDLSLYEYGKVFGLQKGYPLEAYNLAAVVAGKTPRRKYFAKETEPVDFFYIKGALEAALEGFDKISFVAAKNAPAFMHPKICVDVIADGKAIGFLGQVHPLTLKAYDIKTPVFAFEISVKNLEKQFDAQKFKPVAEISKFPSSKRDLSLVIDKNITFGQVQTELLKTGNADNCRLIDLYQGTNLPQDKKSITLRFEFSSSDRTLKDAEVNEKINAVLEILSKNLGAALRS